MDKYFHNSITVNDIWTKSIFGRKQKGWSVSSLELDSVMDLIYT